MIMTDKGYFMIKIVNGNFFFSLGRCFSVLPATEMLPISTEGKAEAKAKSPRAAAKERGRAHA
jgi:hypothetical protein